MDALQDEVESLEAILMDDVRIVRNQQSNAVEAIETTVLPLTDIEEDEQQCICVTLQVLPTAGYPDESPEFKLLRPRGLDDARLEAIRSACAEKIKQSLGFPVVFDLIEVVREHLSGSNLPSGQCVICLYGFCDGDEFTRTECFHYLHSYCLARHLNALRRNYQDEYNKLPAWLQKTAAPFQAACPVCRESIKDETDSLKCAMPPEELANAPDFKVTQELREMQQRMSKLYLQQKSRGAIIDVEAEAVAVISIETEEEVRRRQQRKQREEAEAAAKKAAAAADLQAADAKPTTSSSSNSNNITATTATTNSINFAPVVQQTQRVMPEPTNNNYHHNRRHYRGGRRHNHHHHHHHNRAERDERNNTAASAANTSHSNAASAAVSTNAAAAANHSGKQTKAQIAAGAHAR